MRELKFRAFRNGIMYDGLDFEKILSIAKITGFAKDVITPVIWMQYTGLKDKKGKEIYESDWLDIIDPNGNDIDTHCVFYDTEYGGYFIEDDNEMISIGFAIKQGYEITVIGNQYDK